MEYDRHILNSTNKMRTSWTLINMERGKDRNNLIIQSINTDGKTSTDPQTTADTFNKHFIMIPDIIKIILKIIIKLRLIETNRIFTSWQMHLKLHFLL